MQQLLIALVSGSLFHLAALQSAEAQRVITGRLMDSETGKPVKDASITKAGTDFKTVSNALGFFEVEAKSTTLKIICDGYVTAHVDISGKENVQIQLKRRQFIGGAAVAEAPTFPGGLPAFYEYIRKNINIPYGSPKGTVKVKLVIDPTGVVLKDSVTIIESLSKACDREVLRVMKKSPKWHPGEHENNVTVVLPIKIN